MICWVFFHVLGLPLRLAIGVKGCLCLAGCAIANFMVKEGKNACKGEQTAEKMKSLQHGVFTGGHPSKY